MAIFLLELLEEFILAIPVLLATGVPVELQGVEHFDLVGRENRGTGIFLVELELAALLLHPRKEFFVLLVICAYVEITFFGSVDKSLKEHRVEILNLEFLLALPLLRPRL